MLLPWPFPGNLSINPPASSSSPSQKDFKSHSILWHPESKQWTKSLLISCLSAIEVSHRCYSSLIVVLDKSKKTHWELEFLSLTLKRNSRSCIWISFSVLSSRPTNPFKCHSIFGTESLLLLVHLQCCLLCRRHCWAHNIISIATKILSLNRI